jgi:hypothetical protein
VLGAVNVTVCPAGAWTLNWLRPSLVTVWSVESLLVTATVAPAGTVVGPVKVKFVMVIVADAAGAGAAGADEAGGLVVPEELDDPDELEQAPAPASSPAASPEITTMRALYVMSGTRSPLRDGSIPPRHRTIRPDPVSNDHRR